MTTRIEPNPAMIGGVGKAPLVVLPQPSALFSTRAERLAFLAASGGNLAPYLAFLADLTRVQARLADEGPGPEPLPADHLKTCRESRMPPIDRSRLRDDADLRATLTALCDQAVALDMPEPARLALNAVRGADAADLDWLIGNVLSGLIPADAAAPHLFVAAAVQLHLARLAATLPGPDLVAIQTGTCPACGGRPHASIVTTVAGVENVRYACCATCATQWNEVRVKCLCCGSTKGISYRSVETGEAAIKAELCSECDHWLKILYHPRNHSLEPMADDVASLGLDMMMQGTGLTRGGSNPFTVGY
ncbi:formate dehydrogenase accessory protein FdhE [Paracoccus sp. p4-l81]|uniref:formate dehydrogenase accessory protein FdhE n=1 Tax=Paracoccus sp. p4-l81 TaxID=3342806 RepID=UPI0035BB2535